MKQRKIHTRWLIQIPKDCTPEKFSDTYDILSKHYALDYETSEVLICHYSGHRYKDIEQERDELEFANIGYKHPLEKLREKYNGMDRYITFHTVEQLSDILKLVTFQQGCLYGVSKINGEYSMSVNFGNQSNRANTLFSDLNWISLLLTLYIWNSIYHMLCTVLRRSYTVVESHPIFQSYDDSDSVYIQKKCTKQILVPGQQLVTIRNRMWFYSWFMVRLVHVSLASLLSFVHIISVIASPSTYIVNFIVTWFFVLYIVMYTYEPSWTTFKKKDSNIFKLSLTLIYTFFITFLYPVFVTKWLFL
jgi:hypothetical protein